MEIVRLTEASESALGDINTLLAELSDNAKPIGIDVLQSALSSGQSEIWVAKDEERIVGMVTLITLPKLLGLEGEVDEIVVSSTQRGKGIGRMLMEKIIERARAQDMKRLFLTSRPSREAANALYQKLGFERRDTNVYRMKLK